MCDSALVFEQWIRKQVNKSGTKGQVQITVTMIKINIGKWVQFGK